LVSYVSIGAHEIPAVKRRRMPLGSDSKHLRELGDAELPRELLEVLGRQTCAEIRGIISEALARYLQSCLRGHGRQCQEVCE
jgi:hypothetical protein